jgi:hypothetical protein
MTRTVRVSGATDSTPRAALGGAARRSVRSSGESETRGRATRTTRTARDDSDRSERTESRGRTTRQGGRGFSAYKENVKESRREFNTFSVPEKETVVVAFLEDEPFEHVFRHWINRQPRNCIGDECPPCLTGDVPKAVLLFNVVNMAHPDTVLLWEASADPVKRIEKRYDDLADKGKKLNDEGVYFEVSKKKGKNNYTEYTVDRIYDNVLQDEWEMEPLTEEDREALAEHLYTSDVIKYNTAEELQDWLDSLDD